MGSHSHGTYLPPEEPNAVDDIDLEAFHLDRMEEYEELAKAISSQGPVREVLEADVLGSLPLQP
jgi:hypothetical protein